ncbi:hypothetical protein [Halocalculus aciditolerans]|uniref:hypothetical protein n=1 Tax=Halocalculus aciditolerans TaxID=1383812 RepID=UPI00166444A4|nr:hypothetical protein [Halocalculus aciditolerans]
MASDVAHLGYPLFPPLAAASDSLFTRRHAWEFPWGVPGALTIGPGAGWLATVIVSTSYRPSEGAFTVPPAVYAMNVAVSSTLAAPLYAGWQRYRWRRP